MLIAIATAATLVAAPNYYAAISPETATEIQELVLNGEYRAYLDFNGDGELNIADVVGVSRKYQDNCRYGNEITLDREAVNDIVMENYADDLLYWEIYRVNGNLTRQYELTASEITTAEIYVEFENYGDSIIVEVNPFTEMITVMN